MSAMAGAHSDRDAGVHQVGAAAGDDDMALGGQLVDRAIASATMSKVRWSARAWPRRRRRPRPA